MLFLIQAVLLPVTCTSDVRMGFMFEAALWSQLWELREEPVTVFEEAILVDCVKIVPILIGPVVKFLCKEKGKGVKPVS